MRRRVDALNATNATRPIQAAGGRTWYTRLGDQANAAAIAVEAGIGAATGGHLRAAYAQFVLGCDSADATLRVVDAATREVLSELPSDEVQALSAFLREYARTLALQRLATRA